MTDKTVRVGCLGAARIAPKALVYPAKALGRIELSAIAARDQRRAQEFSKAHGFQRALQSYEDIIADPSIDLIYIPLPIDAHVEWSIRALEAGKHVLCEKPFAMNIDEARQAVACAEKTGKRLIEAFHYRYHPAFETVMAWIAAGRLGEIQSIDAVFNAGIPDRDGAEIRHQPARGGGAFMDLGCYPLNWALTVADAAPDNIEARATLTPKGVDETMEVSLRFAGGVTARLHSSMALDAPRASSLTVVGSRDTLIFEQLIAPQEGAKIYLKSAPQERVPIDRLSTYVHQMRAVVDAIETGEKLPSEGEHILRQQQALDDIYAAAGLSYLRTSSAET
ncbi:MAG: Gfo/Idh/MocA family oxidoreductase [Pseudomonadota bacterium]